MTFNLFFAVYLGSVNSSTAGISLVLSSRPAYSAPGHEATEHFAWKGWGCQVV